MIYPVLNRDAAMIMPAVGFEAALLVGNGGDCSLYKYCLTPHFLCWRFVTFPCFNTGVYTGLRPR